MNEQNSHIMGIFKAQEIREEKKLPKKPKDLIFDPISWHPESSHAWEEDLLEAVSDNPTKDFDDVFRSSTNLGDSSLNTPEEEMPCPFPTVQEGAAISVIEDGLTQTVVSVSVDVGTQSTIIPENAVVLASNDSCMDPAEPMHQEYEDNWGELAEEDNELFTCASAAVVEGIDKEFEDFENTFDENIFYGITPSTSNEGSQDILQKAMSKNEINADMGFEMMQVAHQEMPTTVSITEDMKDPEWIPNFEDDKPQLLHYAKKTQLHIVQKPSMKKKKVGRPCRTEPIRITELPHGIKRGSHQVLASGGVQISSAEIDQLRYRRMRDLNNEASKKCREKRKNKVAEAKELVAIEEEKHRELAEQVAALENHITKWKNIFQTKFGLIPEFNNNAL